MPSLRASLCVKVSIHIHIFPSQLSLSFTSTYYHEQRDIHIDLWLQHT